MGAEARPIFCITTAWPEGSTKVLLEFEGIYLVAIFPELSVYLYV